MDSRERHEDFSLLSGGAELLDRLEPLWLELRQHHADLSPQWRASLLAVRFDERRAQLANKGAHGILVSLATSAGRDIGYCVSTVGPDGTGAVDSIYVAEPHRGRGVGHALLSAAMEWFNRQSVESIAVEVLSGNEPAQRLYARYGFLPRTVRMARPPGAG